MQKLWLKDFELNINPHVADKGQKLLQTGAVRTLREVEKHFWVALVDDEDGASEVEVIITPHKIKAFTCECWSAGRKMMCAHIAATLLKIRQFLEKKALEKQAQLEAKVQSEHGKFTIQTILDTVPPEAIAAFIRAYARRDRDFNLAFKTWFAGMVEAGTRNPFALVLDSVLPKPGKQSTLRDADFRRLKKTLHELEVQMDTALQDGNAPLVFQIASVVLEKIVPLLDKSPENREKQIESFCTNAAEKIQTLYTPAASPELRETVWQFWMQLFEKQPLPIILQRGAIRILCSQVTRDDKFERIKTFYDQTPAPAPMPLLHLFLAALATRGLPQATVRVLEDYADQPQRIREAIVELHYGQYWSAALEACDHFLEKTPFSQAQRRELDHLMLLMAEKNADSGRSIRYLQQRFVATGQFDYFERLKRAAGDGWDKVLHTLLQELRRSNDLNGIAAVLAAEGELQVLAAMLETTNDLVLLARYEDLFLPHNKAFVRDRYATLLSDYLREHFGKPAAAFAREKMEALYAKGYADLCAEIVTILIKAFPERPSLPEELQEITAKNSRKIAII